mmetsp:Transcript_10081/g.20974  ORF Transcript_10081/g.20974 Transcript_10081/m.20974 type:complete len:150 (-) Transcript_10081:464-913(-)
MFYSYVQSMEPVSTIQLFTHSKYNISHYSLSNADPRINTNSICTPMPQQSSECSSFTSEARNQPMTSHSPIPETPSSDTPSPPATWHTNQWNLRKAPSSPPFHPKRSQSHDKSHRPFCYTENESSPQNDSPPISSIRSNRPSSRRTRRI